MPWKRKRRTVRCSGFGTVLEERSSPATFVGVFFDHPGADLELTAAFVMCVSMSGVRCGPYPSASLL